MSRKAPLLSALDRDQHAGMLASAGLAERIALGDPSPTTEMGGRQ